MAETVNVSSGLWPDSRRSNWELTRRRLPNLAMAGGRAKDGSEKASPTPPLATSSESSTGTITPCPAAHHLQYLAVEQDAVAARERLAPEVYAYGLPALDINAEEVVCVGLNREEVTSVPARGDPG
jgi:hypothetical protein